MTLGYWGKAESLAQAAQNCQQAGSRKTEPALAKLIVSPTDQPDLETQVSVNDVGDICYPQTCDILPLFSPQNSRVTLGSLMRKTKT